MNDSGTRGKDRGTVEPPVASRFSLPPPLLLLLGVEAIWPVCAVFEPYFDWNRSTASSCKQTDRGIDRLIDR